MGLEYEHSSDTSFVRKKLISQTRALVTQDGQKASGIRAFGCEQLQLVRSRLAYRQSSGVTEKVYRTERFSVMRRSLREPRRQD